MYVVDKQEIFNELSRIEFENKENEVAIICDGIYPELLKNLEENALASTYPLRGLLIYNLVQQSQHEQQVNLNMNNNKLKKKKALINLLIF